MNERSGEQTNLPLIAAIVGVATIGGSGLGVAGAAQWLANCAVSMSFPWLAANTGLPVTFGFYAAFAFLSILFVLMMVHETKRTELEDMVG
jgi:MFS transporter, SP family, sugar:H+ symporter